MKTRSGRYLLVLFMFLYLHASAQKKEDYKVIGIAFYNLENLFDTVDDPLTYDDDRTPKGKDHWTEEIYREKVKNMAYAISQIGLEQTNNAPVLVGVCELENLKVLEDLVQEPVLSDRNYSIVHFDSPDRRGIDVALLYQRDFFIPQHAVSHELLIYDSHEPEKRVYTRDQLVVSGFLEGEAIHLIVNHWPSRSGGLSRSSYKREKAAALNRKIIDSIQYLDPYAKIISMGDFNDDSRDKSLKRVLKAKEKRREVSFQELYNPMAYLAKKGLGSLAYRDGWNLFDQIIVSHSLLEKDYSSYRFYKAGIFNAGFLTTPTGQYKGYPFRSFGFGGYTGGYSDHFPVYILLVKKASPLSTEIPKHVDDEN